MVMVMFGTNKVHGKDRATFGTTVVFVGLVQVDPDDVVRFSRET
jgi:hypothetical protein